MYGIEENLKRLFCLLKESKYLCSIKKSKDINRFHDNRSEKSNISSLLTLSNSKIKINLKVNTNNES
jgi:hypothetical protein